MCGLLAAEGVRVSEERVGYSLHRVAPINHQARQSNTARKLNPVPYHANYFGHKLHIDQNEKLVMYGVTHICASDGYSSKIVAFLTMPVKNNLEIYEHFYRYVCHIYSTYYYRIRAIMCTSLSCSPTVAKYGMWDQLRVDQGKEWYLSLFVQEQLAHLRTNTQRAPHAQTSSKLVTEKSCVAS